VATIREFQKLAWSARMKLSTTRWTSPAMRCRPEIRPKSNEPDSVARTVSLSTDALRRRQFASK